MDLISIGEAAARLQMSTSALRYYDERGLVSPRLRRAGKRMYGPEELRRLALLKIVNRLGLPLDTAAAVLDVIAQAQGAQQFLTHALRCPKDHPARECATMIEALDRLVDGMSVEELAAGQTGNGWLVD